MTSTAPNAPTVSCRFCGVALEFSVGLGRWAAVRFQDALCGGRSEHRGGHAPVALEANATLRYVEVPSAVWTKHHSERSEAKRAKADGEGRPHCVVCGAKLDPERAQTVHIVGGGGSILHPADEARYVDDGGDMGAWDLGPECARLIKPAEFRAPMSEGSKRWYYERMEAASK